MQRREKQHRIYVTNSPLGATQIKQEKILIYIEVNGHHLGIFPLPTPPSREASFIIH